MKVIAKIDSDNYMCSISHTELEKFMNLYYGNMDQLKVGAVVDLGRGHDYTEDMERAFTKTQEFILANEKVVTAIMNGLRFNKQEPDK